MTGQRTRSRRVSSIDQNTDRQLEAVSIEKVFGLKSQCGPETIGQPDTSLYVQFGRLKSMPAAAMNGAGERAIAKTTGLKSRRILRGHMRSDQPFQENAAANLGL